MSELDALQAEVNELRTELAAMRAQLSQRAQPPAGRGTPADEPTGRRTFVRRAGLLAAAGIAGAAAAMTSSERAAAINGDLVLATTNVADSQTGLAVESSGSLPYGIAVTDNGLGSVPPIVNQSALLGHAMKTSFLYGVGGYATSNSTNSAVAGVVGFADQTAITGVLGVAVTGPGVVGWSTLSAPSANPPTSFGTGVYGVSETLSGVGVAGRANGPLGVGVAGLSNGTAGVGVTGTAAAGGIGVEANSAAGPALQASSSTGYGVVAGGGLAALHLLGANGNGAPPARSSHYFGGEIDIDPEGDIWACVIAGAPGTWRKLAGRASAGAFHILPATVRVYDSRAGLAPLDVVKGKIDGAADRVIDLTHSASGVPAGATAVMLNLTATGTDGAGFLSLFKNGIPWPGTSSINWDHANQNIANLSVVAVDDNAKLAVRCLGQADFLIDVIGYYQ